VPDTAIRSDRLETLQNALHVAAQIALDLELVVRDRMNDFVQLLRSKILRAQVGINVRLLENALGRAQADPVDVGLGRLDAFVRWNFNSE
jgi:hypothetical protein